MVSVDHIYRLTCTTTGDSYIGCSANVKKRFREHRSLLRRGLHQAKSLQELWAATDEAEWRIKSIEELWDATTDEKRDRERYHMDQYEKRGSLLNEHKCSFAPPAGAQAKAAAARVANGYRPSAESNRKRSEAQKGRPKRRGYTKTKIG